MASDVRLGMGRSSSYSYLQGSLPTASSQEPGPSNSPLHHPSSYSESIKCYCQSLVRINQASSSGD